MCEDDGGRKQGRWLGWLLIGKMGKEGERVWIGIFGMTSAPSLQSNNLVISTLLDSRIKTGVQDL